MQFPAMLKQMPRIKVIAKILHEIIDRLTAKNSYRREQVSFKGAKQRERGGRGEEEKREMYGQTK